MDALLDQYYKLTTGSLNFSFGVYAEMLARLGKKFEEEDRLNMAAKCYARSKHYADLHLRKHDRRG